MKRRGWRDYDDGFDEVALHEDEELYFEATRKRPKLRAVRRPRPPERSGDEEHYRRRARVKAWGVPY